MPATSRSLLNTLTHHPAWQSTLVVEAPWGHIEQCCNGHLLCAEAEDAGTMLASSVEIAAIAGQQVQASCASRVRTDRGPKCPVCRHGLPSRAIRALSAEQSIAGLPSRCRHCQSGMPRGSLRAHEAACPQVPTSCVAGGDGCRWTGAREERDAHEATCVWGEADTSRRLNMCFCFLLFFTCMRNAL
jgi:hypothetical protein